MFWQRVGKWLVLLRLQNTHFHIWASRYTAVGYEWVEGRARGGWKGVGSYEFEDCGD
jgi:hypothetical protein